MKHPSHILSDFFVAERCAGEYQERWKERKRGVFTFRFPPSHLALPSVTLLAFRLISSSACNPSKDHWAPVNPGQKPLSALTQLLYLAAKRKEKQLYCSRRLGGGHTLSKIFFRCTVSSILQGSIKANFYYWNHSTFVPLWNLCVQNSSPNLQAPGPKLLTVVYFSSSEQLDYFRLHIRFQCSGNIIEHIQDHFCLRKRTIIYPITNFICVIQLQPDGFLFEISNKWVIKKLC